MKICPQCSKEFGDEYKFCPDDGTPLAKIVKKQDPLIGKTIYEKYEILELLREDNLGRVFKAKQMPLGRTVILELFNTKFTTDEHFRTWLNEAIRKYSKLQHANIGTIFDMDETEDGRFFITSEFVEGRTLGEILGSEAPLDQERALNIFYQVADALQHAHSNIMEHGYLTPKDIIIYHDPDGKECVQILNFGISKILLNEKMKKFEISKSEEDLSVEDVAFISPDQSVSGASVDDLDDIYSYGVMLYYALSGDLPFQADSVDSMIEAHASLDVVPLKHLPQCKHIHSLWDDIVGKCIQRSKNDRFQSIKEIKIRLQEIAQFLKQEAEPTIMRMSSDLLDMTASKATNGEGVEETLEPTEVTPPPPSGKKKSPPLAKTFMIQREELNLNEGENYEKSMEKESPSPEETLPEPPAIELEEVMGESLPEEDVLEQVESTKPSGLEVSSEEEELYEGETIFMGTPTNSPEEELEDEVTLSGVIDTETSKIEDEDESLYGETVMVTPQMYEEREKQKEALKTGGNAPPPPPPPVLAEEIKLKGTDLSSAKTLEDEIPSEIPVEDVIHAKKKKSALMANKTTLIVLGVAAVLLVAIVVVGTLVILNILKPKYGSFSVRSYPEKANVYLDGNYIGLTPLTQENIDTGTHQLKIAKDGYKPISKKISIEPDKKLSLGVIKLEKLGAPQETGPSEEQVVQLDALQTKCDEAMANGNYFNPPEDSAISYINQILAVDPENEYAKQAKMKIINEIKTKADEAVKRGNWFLAEKLYGQLFQIAPDDAEVSAGLEKSKMQVALYFKKKAQTIKRLQRRAQNLYQEGNVVTPSNTNAYEVCKHILKLDRKNSFVRSMIRKIKNKANMQIDDAILSENWDKALRYLQGYIRYFPNEIIAKRKMEKVRAKLEKKQQQHMIEEQKLKQQQAFKQAVQTMKTGEKEYARGNYANAIDLLQRALRVNPNLADAAFYIGASYLEIKNYSKAEKFFSKAIQINPNHALAHFNLGIMAKAEGKYDIAIAHLQKVIALGGIPKYPPSRLSSIVNDLLIKKKFSILLNRSIAVEHKHFIGSCSGYLIFTTKTIRYETTESKHGFDLPLKSLSNIRFGKSEEFVFKSGGNKYRFNIKNPNAFKDMKKVLVPYIETLKR